jgi:dihydroorotase
LEEGGLGVGFGINYSPGADQEEIASLFSVAAQNNAPVFVHTRAFGLGAIDEVIETAEATGAALHIVHIGSSSMDALGDARARVADARDRGLDVTTEVYPYTVASTRLESAMFNPGWQENLPIEIGDIEWVATGERLTPETFDERRAEGGWILLYMMRDENVDRGVEFVDGKGHPRGAGTYARVLGHYVRERGVLPLMDALAKMTILPAKRLETVAPVMRNKGRIREGADADITVFDPATVIDRATFAEPTLPSGGIPHVLVAGTFVVRDGELVEGAVPGVGIRGR